MTAPVPPESPRKSSPGSSDSPIAVSILIPTYRRLAYLREAVASALAQTRRDIEIVVGDDGDVAAIRTYVEGLAREDVRVRYQKNSRRLGLAGNWNALADAARGTFAVFMGDDDRLLPDFAERLLGSAASAAKDVSVVFSNHFFIDAQGDRLATETQAMTTLYRRDQLAPGLVADAVQTVWSNSVPMSSALVRLADVRRLRFKEDLNTPEIEVFARLAQEGASFVFVPDYLAEYRSHSGSYTSAGLWTERLARHMENIDVPAHVEPTKRAFMEMLLVSGVGRLIDVGDVAGASTAMTSRYYPSSWGNPKVWLQRAATRLPAPLARRFYRTAASGMGYARARLKVSRGK